MSSADERVHEHDDRLQEPSELTQRKSETITWSSELRGPDQHEVEVPVADQLRQQIEVADGQLGDRERDAGDAVEERDLLHAPAAELRHVVEDDEDCDEVEERDEEHAHAVEGERRPVLPLGAYARRDEPDVERQRLSHPAPPAFSFLARTRVAAANSATASRAASRAWRRAPCPVVAPTKTSTGSWSMLGNGVAYASVCEPLREEADGDDEAGEERGERDRDAHRAAVVEQPERREVVQEAEARSSRRSRARR